MLRVKMLNVCYVTSPSATGVKKASIFWVIVNVVSICCLRNASETTNDPHGLCVQMEVAWKTVAKVSSWIRSPGTVSPVTPPVVPAEGHDMMTATPAGRGCS